MKLSKDRVGELGLFDATAFDQALAEGADALPLFRNTLHGASQKLKTLFAEGTAIDALVHGRAWLIDQLLVRAWRRFVGRADSDLALVAVGGYGRGELNLLSDIDLLVLLRGADHSKYQPALEAFLTFLWDIGLEVGHSVRSLDECIHEAERDITIVTNLMEARLLTGPADLFQAMRESVGPSRIWPSRRFFEAKWQEQIARHAKYFDTAYNLEPNIKEGPGGLRDIQSIGWVTKRHFGAETLHDLVLRDFLTETEYQTLMAGQAFLWRIRFALHALTGRREDRLLFDYQRTLAEQFGYRDEAPVSSNSKNVSSRAADGHRLGVELFMKQYYRTVMELNRLNEMLLQLYQEAILYADDSGEPVAINKRFQARKGFIEVTGDDVFRRYPFALLEVFLLLQQNPDLKGVSAATIRLIRDHRYLIDEAFRKDLRCRSLFIEILRQPQGITHELRRMNRYGILAAYLPAFSRIVGQMQYDLFHVYTVDEHSLFVIRNLRRFTIDQHRHEFPLCSSIVKRIPKPELLYLAGLYHDIAKGRGGDHSTLGADEARTFCRQHGLSKYDTDLVAWLVQHHLLMSVTAQHKDLTDPAVVNAFATTIEDQVRLDYLYLLTVADMRATNPNIWNNWKDALLIELYNQTKRAFRRGLENPIDKRERVRETQSLARRQLLDRGIKPEAINRLWEKIDDDYFLHYSGDEVVWHTQHIVQVLGQDEPRILVKVREQGARGGTEVFIYAPVRDDLFAILTTTLDRLGLNIVEARVNTSLDGYALDTYNVLEQSGEAISDPFRVKEIAEQIDAQIRDPALKPSTRNAARQVKHFNISTDVVFSHDERNRRTVMEVITADRPGLLSRIGFAMLECSVQLHNAKIATFGAHVEDVFFVTDANNSPIEDEAQLECLKNRIREYLDK